MAAIKDLSATVAKWQQRAGAAGADYGKGIAGTTKDWATNTALASDSWNQGVTQAAGQGRFAAGVRKAGTDKWKSNATSKGVQRYPGGVQLAGPAYQAGFQPYHDKIASTTLPPRGPKGSPNNLARVQAIADALHRQKTGQ